MGKGHRKNEARVEQEVVGILDRGDFLKLAGAAGLGVAAGTGLMQSGAGAAVETNLEPTDFTFTIRERFRPFHLLAENFVELDDSFDSDTADNYEVLAPESNAGEVGVGNGKLSISGGGHYTILKSDTGQRAPFATVIVDVAALPADGTVYAGLYGDENTYVHAYYDRDTNTVGLEARVNGGEVDTLGTFVPDREEFGTAFRFAFVVNENRVIALVGDRFMDIGNFRPLIERDVFFETGNGAPGTLDLRDETVLAEYNNGFGARSDPGGGAIVFERVRAGYFGEAGVRDPHVVQYADGTPYIVNNKLYFTLTNAGLGFFEKAHWGVWTMDLSDYTDIEQVGNIFWRNADDAVVPPTKVLGHHAGQIVRDEANGRWIVVASSWGDFGPQGGDRALTPGTVTPNPANPPVDILYATESDSEGEIPLSVNLLRGVHVLLGRKHPVNAVPFPTEGKWDPGLTRIGGRWYMAYVIATDLFTDFQPALARSPRGGDYLDTVEFVGADWGKRATEGPILQKLGGEWRLFATTGDDEPREFQNRYPIYRLFEAAPAGTGDPGPRLVFDGYLEAPHPTNIPHPMIVPIPIRSGGRRRTKYIMITFNGDQFFERVLGYGTHGDFFVMEAKQTVRGREF
jgi:hypothetical protein